MSGHVIKLRGLGRLRGVTERNVDGGSYLAFKGVPYARPPVGQLRFSDPVPSEQWTGIRDAVKFGNACGQFDIVTKSIAGSDDCLYLNVYVPSTDENEKDRRNLPVMVYFHGGAFIFGTGDNFLYGPDYLVKKDVIIVTVNYRLGVLGFLNLEHRIAPGNQGLKDQVLALRWVQEHVESFGGDKNNVTIFGESAGASSVHYLTLSPLAEGLFHKAILQSGTASSPWASILQSPKRYADRLLKYFGKTTSSNVQETVDFLRTVDCAKLIEAQTKIQSMQERLQLVQPFGPGPDDAAEKPFLPNFVSSIKNGVVKVPLILGYNDAEGIALLNGLKESSCKEMNANFEYVLHPQVLAAMKRDKNSTPAQIRRFYFGDEPLHPEKSLLKFVEMSGDMHFLNSVYDLAEIQAKKSAAPTYFYRYSFDKGNSFVKMLYNLNDMPGACHSDELLYLFYPHGLCNLGFESPKPGSTERRHLERMTQMWTDFAKTGNPIPAESEFVKTTWKPIKETNELHYLELNEELSPALNPDAARRLVWSKLTHKL